MARRKDAAVATSALSRSQAAIFNDPGAHEMLGVAPGKDPKKEITEKGKSASFAADEDDIAEITNFPLSLIYDLQDFLNTHLTVSRGVQMMVCLYLCQIFYIYLHKERGMDVLSAVGFNILSVVVAMYLSHRSLLKKHLASPETKPYPELPSFNSIYALFIPYSFVLLLCDPADPFFQVNLSLSNFSLKNLHPVAKVLSAFVYNYMFGDANTMNIVLFVRVVWIYFTVDYALSMWNEERIEKDDGTYETRRSMDAAEIHIVTIFMVNLLGNFRIATSDTTLPIVIMRILTIAMVGALALSTPFYYAYTQVQKGVLRSGVSVVVVTVFAATFYFFTNYMFYHSVALQEVIHWLLEFIWASELRVNLLRYWVLALALIVPIVFYLSSQNILSLNDRRKIWHFALVAALAYPALVLEPVFTAIAVLGSAFVFIALECLRCTRVTFLGDYMNCILHLFQDEKDLKGPLSLSYIFLVVGVAIPIAYGIIVEDVVSIRSYLGLVALGLGDSSASIIGKRFGKNHWRGESKTIEGTVTYMVVTFASLVFIDFYLLPESARVQNWENIVIVSLVGGAIEGSALLNDNVLIPCITLITYELLNKVF